jgi:hypothetical protein
VVSRLHQLVALSRLRSWRQGMIVGGDHLFIRLSATGSDDAVDARFWSQLAWLEGFGHVRFPTSGVEQDVRLSERTRLVNSILRGV